MAYINILHANVLLEIVHEYRVDIKEIPGRNSSKMATRLQINKLYCPYLDIYKFTSTCAPGLCTLYARVIGKICFLWLNTIMQWRTQGSTSPPSEKFFFNTFF